MKIGRGFLKRTTVVMLLLVTCFGCDARSAGTPESMAAYAMRTVLDEYVAQHESFPESWAELMAEPEFREKFEPYLQKFNLRLSLWRGELTVMQQEYAFLKAPVPMRGYGSNARVLLIQRTLQKSSELRLRLGYILAFQDRTKPGWFGEEEGRTLLESVELQPPDEQLIARARDAIRAEFEERKEWPTGATKARMSYMERKAIRWIVSGPGLITTGALLVIGICFWVWRITRKVWARNKCSRRTLT